MIEMEKAFMLREKFCLLCSGVIFSQLFPHDIFLLMTYNTFMLEVDVFHF